ncbi:MAG TPA: 3,4-dihydroxy-2-butanone-4-phosphate synthase [Candidatus Dormibacteraeota bacterium]|nr:3,4-dihydroxy-2-butanone-4-phosphate synthase [Candidatus Dormibacteraeota bacterium]
MSVFCSVEQALEEIKKGKLLIIVDDPGRENQGDLFFPAEAADTEKVNFMIQAGRGLICVPVTGEYAARLDLPPMVEPGLNTESTRVNFSVSVDARTVTAFGISAADRAKTIRTIIDKKAKPADLVRPGHVFPLLASDGGVLERAGHTEASSELADLAGFAPCGVICEILNDSGEPSEGAELIAFAKKHDLKIVSIADLVSYRRSHPKTHAKPAPATFKAASSMLPTEYGDFQLNIYKSTLGHQEHAVLLLDKEPVSAKPMLTRVHSKCLTGDSFSSLRCDCQAQLHRSLEMIQAAGRGVLIYLDQEGRGIGLANKVKAYALQDEGYDTAEANQELGFEADPRTYEAAAQILNDLKIAKIDLLTNNPHKQEQLTALGISVNRRIPLEISPNKLNAKYLATKKHKFGHRLTEV